MDPALRLALVLLLLASTTFAQQNRGRSNDREAVTRLESEWLHGKDEATLDRILAADFVHMIPVDHFMNRHEHVDRHLKHPEPKEHHTKYDNSSYVSMAILRLVNGSVIAINPLGKGAREDDVDGKGQAVNAQKNAARPEP
jgi:hypothetical protein